MKTGWYTSGMFNKTFYRFLFGFLAIVVVTLGIILVVGNQYSA